MQYRCIDPNWAVLRTCPYLDLTLIHCSISLSRLANTIVTDCWVLTISEDIGLRHRIEALVEPAHQLVQPIRALFIQASLHQKPTRLVLKLVHILHILLWTTRWVMVQSRLRIPLHKLFILQVAHTRIRVPFKLVIYQSLGLLYLWLILVLPQGWVLSLNSRETLICRTLLLARHHALLFEVYGFELRDFDRLICYSIIQVLIALVPRVQRVVMLHSRFMSARLRLIYLRAIRCTVTMSESVKI